MSTPMDRLQQIRRINRLLAPLSFELCASLNYRDRTDLGHYYVLNLRNKVVVRQFVDLDKLEAELTPTAA